MPGLLDFIAHGSNIAWKRRHIDEYFDISFGYFSPQNTYAFATQASSLAE